MTSTELAAWRRQLVALRERLAGDLAAQFDALLEAGH